MCWLVSVMTVGCLLGVSLGQGKYGAPYKGPPVVPVILPGGFLADTREVAAAKEYHLSAVAKAASDVKKPNGYYKPSVYKPPQKADYQPHNPRLQEESEREKYTEPHVFKSKGYRGPKPSTRPAPVYEDDLSATPEAEYDEGVYREQEVYYSGSSQRPDPMVTPIILDNGFIADTPQVTAAKDEHFAAVAKAHEALAEVAQRSAAQAAAQQAASPPRVAADAPPPPQPQNFRGYSEY